MTVAVVVTVIAGIFSLAMRSIFASGHWGRALEWRRYLDCYLEDIARFGMSPSVQI